MLQQFLWSSGYRTYSGELLHALRCSLSATLHPYVVAERALILIPLEGRHQH
jgi:hypothetical protein